MNNTEIRTLIRSVLRDELGKIKMNKPKQTIGQPTGQTIGQTIGQTTGQPTNKEESVKIGSDQELTAFARRIASLCKEEGSRRDIENGNWTFRLNSQPARLQSLDRSPARIQASPGQAMQFEKGFINERQIDALSEDTTKVVINKTVKFTPLAQDRLRQRGIKIERKSS